MILKVVENLIQVIFLLLLVVVGEVFIQINQKQKLSYRKH